MSRTRAFLILLLANVAATGAVYAGAFIPSGLNPRPGFDVVYRHWDGPPYVVVAKSLYDPLDEVWRHYGRRYGQNWGAEDHAAHLILYPLSVRAMAPIAGYWNALLLATFLYTTAALWVLYCLFRDFGLVSQPLWAALAFVVFPPRWLLVHSIGASEPAFLLFLLGAVYCYRRRWLWAVGLLGALAGVTRIYGILLLPAFVLCEIVRVGGAEDWEPRAMISAVHRRELAVACGWLLLIPALLAIHFGLYHFRLGSFWAYFDQNASVLTAIPFWRMYGPMGYGNVLLHFFLLYGVAWCWVQGHRDLAIVSSALLVPNFFVTLHDLGRFLIPVYPLLLFAPFDFLWQRRESRFALAACLPMIYAYTWGSLPRNTLHPRIYESLASFLSS